MKDLNYLIESYKPKKILHRDEQITEIKKLFKCIKNKNLIGEVKLIQGVTGSGKTATTNYLIENNRDKCFYASGDVTKTSFRTLITLLGNWHNTEEKAATALKEELKKEKKLIVIDEVHKIKDLNNFLQHLNTIYRETNTPILLITNRGMFITKMPEDVKLTLLIKKIKFPSYMPDQLYDILNERLKEGSLTIPESKKRYMCAIGTKQGSARLTLRLAYEYLTKQEKDINKIIESLNKEEWEEIINSLCFSERTFLRNLLDLTENGKRKVTTSEIQQISGKISPSRISQIISSMKDYGLIKSEQVNLGRKGGKFSYINFVNKEVSNVIENIIITA